MTDSLQLDLGHFVFQRHGGEIVVAMAVSVVEVLGYLPICVFLLTLGGGFEELPELQFECSVQWALLPLYPKLGLGTPDRSILTSCLRLTQNFSAILSSVSTCCGAYRAISQKTLSYSVTDILPCLR